jgi:hypothetical protein
MLVARANLVLENVDKVAANSSSWCKFDQENYCW